MWTTLYPMPPRALDCLRPFRNQDLDPREHELVTRLTVTPSRFAIGRSLLDASLNCHVSSIKIEVWYLVGGGAWC